MAGEVFSATKSVPVRLSSPLSPSGRCGASNELLSGRFTITIDGGVVQDQSRVLPYTYAR